MERRTRDEDRSERTERSSRDRDDNRSERGRNDERDNRSRGRDSEDNRNSRSEGRGDSDSRGRDRDNDSSGRRGSSRDDDSSRDFGRSSRSRDDYDSRDRGSRQDNGRSFEYQRRDSAGVRDRANRRGNNDFDSFVKSNLKAYKVKDGRNSIRFLPPTWPNAEHYGYDIHVHYGVGPDRQAYLCLHKMKGEADPIHDEYSKFARTADRDNKDDKQMLKDLEAKRRVLVYLIDRDNEKEGVQYWAMPWTLDRDISQLTVDKTGAVLMLDDPEEGYDVDFNRSGKGDRTEYTGIAISRRDSPLGGRGEWLDFAVENPLPDQLVYYSYDHIAKAFGAQGEETDRRGSSSDRDDGHGRDGNRSRDRDERDSRDDSRGRDRDRGRSQDPDYTWESIHAMKGRELDDLIELEKLDINPDKAKDDEDLADWICEEMKIAEPRRGSREESRDDSRGRDNNDERDDRAERLRRMRENAKD